MEQNNARFLEGECIYCGKKNYLKVCESCGVQGLINNFPEVFQETVFDKLNPKIEEINFKLNEIIIALSNYRLIKKKVSKGLLNTNLGGYRD